MTDVPHSTLTTTDLHEPKGVASATANQVYVADGNGTGVWTTVDALLASAVTGATTNDIMTYDGSKAVWTAPSSSSGKVYLEVSLPDGAGTNYTTAHFGTIIPATGTITKVIRAHDTSSTIQYVGHTVYKNGITGIGTVQSSLGQTQTFVGTGYHYSTTVTPSPAVSVTLGDTLFVKFDGDTTAGRPHLIFELTPS